MTTSALSAISGGVDITFPIDWETDIEAWGEQMQLYLDYIDGKHRLEMTQEVADLLMIEKVDGERFVVNYSELIMQKLADRLKVTSIKALPVFVDDDDDDDGSDSEKEAATKTAEKLTKWADRFRQKVRFDGLQIDNHESAISTGDSFVMIDSAPLANGEEFPAMTVEPAFNGSTGIVPIYDLTQQHMLAVAKIWEHDERKRTTVEDGDDLITSEFRVNIYYPDRVEKFVTDDGNLKKFVEAIKKPDGTINNTNTHPWVDSENKPLGIPFVHFKHNGRSGKWNGKSGIKSVIPLNDVLNRSTMNMTLITNLTAAQIRYIIGANVPAGKITPGMWVKIMEDGVPIDVHMPEVGTFEIGEITPVIEECLYTVDQMANITDTPLPGTMGSSIASGESLKQREVGFTARAEKLQTKFGNKWEDVIDLAYRVQAALGNKKPPKGADGWETIWKPAEVRNDTEVVNNANAIVDHIDRRTYLETIAPVYSWDAARIDEILKRQSEEVEESNGSPFPRTDANSFADALRGGGENLSPLERTAEALGG